MPVPTAPTPSHGARRAPAPRARRLATALLGTLLLAPAVAACSDDEGALESPVDSPVETDGDGPLGEPLDPSGTTYVALGDSYTAAPYVGETTDETCLRTDANYPTLVAEELDLELTDVSCGGADTSHLTAPQPLSEEVPPQLDAVEEDTDIVTLSLGGNDNGYFAGLVGCAQLGATDPDGAPCRERFGSEDPARDRALMEDSAATLTENVAGAIRAVVDKAPDARVLVVGYPQFTPEEGTCPEFPVAAGDLALVRSLNVLLNDAVAAAADAEGVTYVDLYAATQGHDVCSEDPWVAGPEPEEPAAPYHPYAAEQEAAADAVVAAIEAG